MGKLKVGIVTCIFSQICNRFMALDWWFLQQEKHYSGAIVRFSDNSSLYLLLYTSLEELV